MPPTYCIILAGGKGRHLGGVSKADVSIEGCHLFDRVMAGVHLFVSGQIAAVTPDSVDAPPGVLRTLEDPPAGGPLVRIDTGLKVLDALMTPIHTAAPTRTAVPVDSSRGALGSAAFADRSVGEPSAVVRDMVFVFAVDTPQTRILTPRLATATRGRDDAVVVDGESPFRQCLQMIYRIGALRATIEEAGGPRNKGTRRVLAGLDPVEVPSSAGECRGVDTPGNVPWWSKALGLTDSGITLQGPDP